MISAFESPPSISFVSNSLSLGIPQGKDGDTGKGWRGHDFPARDPMGTK